MSQRTLLYDLEITPILGWAYEMWEANVIRVERQPIIMCFSYKWLGDKRIHNVAQPDFPLYEKDPHSDYHVVKELHTLMGQASIVVAHNANKFDNRVSTARFLEHGFGPPSPYRTVDTLQVARRYFRFGSNSLANLCERLGIGGKAKDTHGKLWHDCVNGDLKAWKRMRRYNNQDVVLLEGLYERLMPYISNHPNVALLSGEEGCPKCGASHLQSRGFAYTATGTYRRFQCQDCGGWSRERLADKEAPRPTLVNAS